MALSYEEIGRRSEVKIVPLVLTDWVARVICAGIKPLRGHIARISHNYLASP